MTTKELKKKHPSRLVGGAETGRHSGKDMQQGGWQSRQMKWRLADWAVSHLHADKLVGTTRE